MMLDGNLKIPMEHVQFDLGKSALISTSSQHTLEKENVANTKLMSELSEIKLSSLR